MKPRCKPADRPPAGKRGVRAGTPRSHRPGLRRPPQQCDPAIPDRQLPRVLRRRNGIQPKTGGPKLDDVIASLHRSLDAKPEEGLRRTMHFPPRRDPYFKDFMTLAEVYPYATQHFDQPTAHSLKSKARLGSIRPARTWEGTPPRMAPGDPRAIRMSTALQGYRSPSPR